MTVESKDDEKPESFTDDYLLYLLAQASAAASESFHKTLAADGLSVSTWRIIASLYPRKTLNVGRLAQDCLLKQPTLTRALDRLAKIGLVERAQSSSDRRGVLVQLTKSGYALAKKKVAEAKAHENKLLQKHSQSEIVELKRILEELLSDVTRLER